MNKRKESINDALFQRIYADYYTLMCRYALQFLADEVLAEEVVEEVIFHLWETRNTLSIDTDLRAYLFRSVRNRCLNELSSLRHRSEVAFSAFSSPEHIELLQMVFDGGESALDRIINNELAAELDACIRELPVECRRVFEKSRLEQKCYQEIADELGISINTVKYHMKHALQVLQRRVKEVIGLLVPISMMGQFLQMLYV